MLGVSWIGNNFSLISDADEDAGDVGPTWLSVYWAEFRRRVLQLFGYEFAKFPAHLALSILQLKNTSVAKHLTRNGNYLQSNNCCFAYYKDFLIAI